MLIHMKQNDEQSGVNGMTTGAEGHRVPELWATAFRVPGCRMPRALIEKIVIDSAWDAPMIASRVVHEGIEFRFPDEHGPGYLDRLSERLNVRVMACSPQGPGWQVIYVFRY